MPVQISGYFAHSWSFLLAGIQGDHVGVGVPALRVGMLRPDLPGGMMTMSGCSQGQGGAGRVGDRHGAGGSWRDDRLAQWRFRAARPTRVDPFPARIVVDHPGASCPPERPLIVVRTLEWAEQALGAGQIGCPHPGCGGTLTRWGYGRRRRVRSLGARTLDIRPRRARCTRCAHTQILLPAAVQPRLADTTEVIGTALAGKAAGHGHRRIADELQRSASTVRRWMRRAMRSAHLQWLWRRGSQVLIRLDPDAFNQLPRPTSPLRDALTVLAAAACAARRRLGLTDPVWTLIGLHTQGRLLAAPT